MLNCMYCIVMMYTWKIRENMSIWCNNRYLNSVGHQQFLNICVTSRRRERLLPEMKPHWLNFKIKSNSTQNLNKLLPNFPSKNVRSSTETVKNKLHAHGSFLPMSQFFVDEKKEVKHCVFDWKYVKVWREKNK